MLLENWRGLNRREFSVLVTAIAQLLPAEEHNDE